MGCKRVIAIINTREIKTNLNQSLNSFVLLKRLQKI
jgi:hypothetical protein